jgi:type I restriction enzyme R subunit
MIPYSEDDTRVKFFDPKLKASGWDEENIRRNFYISKGKIIIEADKARRGERRFADYVLFHNQSIPIAVIEAKKELKHPADGIAQAKENAEKLGVKFAFSTNGKGIEEFDFSTNQQNSIEHFPTPNQLYERLQNVLQQDLPDFRNLTNNPLIYPLHYDPRKSPYYFQLAAIKSVILAILKGQKRILLTMATGSGKTYTAFQIVWKLVKSGYLKKVLYLTDRAEVLRDQAYNEFGGFGDARDKIMQGKAPKVRDIYFATYQTLYSGDETKRFYQEYSPEFFDLVIIDECHRSGFGTWHQILKYFSSAIHFGMTATPKRDDNINTYAYFGNPVYEYDMLQAIEDGYLANYLVQRIYTNLDKAGGISLEEAKLQGAEVYIPDEDPERIIKDYYNSAEFEKAVSIPPRTKEICRNLAKLLGTYGPTERTIIYCVSTDHAADVKRELQNHFAHLGHSNYAARIVSEDEVDKKQLENFKDSEKIAPVVATTVDLLTTGVDIPSVKNIVFLRTLSSVVLFNQIIGRGTRIDEVSNKYYFRIIDYTGATRLFSELTGPPPSPPASPETGDYYLKGQVFDGETQAPIEGATIIVIPKPNEQLFRYTDKDGFFFYKKLPRRPVKLIAKKSGYTRKEMTAYPTDDSSKVFHISLYKEREKKKPIVIDKIPVHVETEEEILVEAGGKLLKKAEYIKYSQEGIKQKVVSLEDLRKIWLDDQKRRQLLNELTSLGISPQVISSLNFQRGDIDGFDILGHVAFDAPIVSRDERAKAIINLKQKFISSFSKDTREIILDLIDQYRLGGIEDLKPEVVKLPHFEQKYKGTKNIINKFGKPDTFHKTINKIKELIYAE